MSYMPTIRTLQRSEVSEARLLITRVEVVFQLSRLNAKEITKLLTMEVMEAMLSTIPSSRVSRVKAALHKTDKMAASCSFQGL